MTAAIVSLPRRSTGFFSFRIRFISVLNDFHVPGLSLYTLPLR
jgi:hypothetical protein